MDNKKRTQKLIKARNSALIIMYILLVMNEYQRIVNPITGRNVNLFGKKGQSVLEKYINHVGGSGAHKPATERYTYADGSKYVGTWKDDNKHGQGTYTYADGSKYVGGWKDDKKHGQGTYTWPEGTYVGEYKNGKRHGQGTKTRADGRIIHSGEWVNNEANGNIIFSNSPSVVTSQMM